MPSLRFAQRVSQLIKFAVSGVIFTLILMSVPWRDSVILADGEFATLVQWQEKDLALVRMESGQLIEVRMDQIVRVDFGLVSLIRNADTRWVFGYFSVSIIAAACFVLRWKLLISANGANIGISWCIREWAGSQLLNILPLGQLGGDALRIQRGTTLGLSLGNSTGIVATERVFGFAILLVIASVGLSMSGLDLFRFEHMRFVVIVLLLAALFLAVARVRSLIASFGFLGPIGKLVRSPGLAFGIAIISAIPHLCVVATFYFADRCIGIGAPYWCYLIAVPTIMVVQVLPIHVAGIGVLEGGLWYFMELAFNATAADAIAVSTILRILGLLWMLVLLIITHLPIQSYRDEPRHS